jgi:hypothetical protein
MQIIRGPSLHRFHENCLSQLGAQREAGVADDANDIRSAAQQPNDLFLAQADFAQSLSDIRRGAKLLYAYRHPGAHPIQRAKQARTRSPFGRWWVFSIVHHRRTKSCYLSTLSDTRNLPNSFHPLSGNWPR